MKKILLPIFICLLVLAATAPIVSASASTYAYSTCVSVVGEASLELTPDRATIHLSIENVDKDVSQAQAKTFALFDDAVKALKEVGVSEESIVVESYNSYPSYDYSCGKSLLGYYSNLSFTFSVDSLENLKESIDSVTSQGVCVQNICYEASNEKESYNEALSKALEEARIKAENLLGRNDLTLTNIEEESVYYSSSLYRCYDASPAHEDLVGKVTIRARIKAQFC